MKVSDEIVAEARERRAAGQTVREIASALKVSTGCIHNHVRDVKIDIAKKMPKPEKLTSPEGPDYRVAPAALPITPDSVGIAERIRQMQLEGQLIEEEVRMRERKNRLAIADQEAELARAERQARLDERRINDMKSAGDDPSIIQGLLQENSRLSDQISQMKADLVEAKRSAELDALRSDITALRGQSNLGRTQWDFLQEVVRLGIGELSALRQDIAAGIMARQNAENYNPERLTPEDRRQRREKAETIISTLEAEASNPGYVQINCPECGEKLSMDPRDLKKFQNFLCPHCQRIFRNPWQPQDELSGELP